MLKLCMGEGSTDGRQVCIHLEIVSLVGKTWWGVAFPSCMFKQEVPPWQYLLARLALGHTGWVGNQLSSVLLSLRRGLSQDPAPTLTPIFSFLIVETTEIYCSEF